MGFADVSEQPRSVLDGIDVLDLTRAMAGAISTMLLANHGARVTRVERPGDDPLELWPGARVWPPGKRRAHFDLRDPGDLAAVQALAARAHIVVRSFRPGVATRHGLDHATITASSPSVITCAITGYGNDNRHAARPAYDALVAARTGLQWENRSWMGGAIDHIHGIDSPVPRSRVAAGPGARRTTFGPDLRLHRVAEPVCRVPRDHRHQCRAARAARVRPGAVDRDVAVASGNDDHHGQVAACREPLGHGVPHVDHRCARTEGSVSLRR